MSKWSLVTTTSGLISEFYDGVLFIKILQTSLNLWRVAYFGSTKIES